MLADTTPSTADGMVRAPLCVCRDPGNWATGLAGGAKFGYSLLFVILVSNILAMFLQHLALKLGVASGRDLAQACRDAYPRWVLATRQRMQYLTGPVLCERFTISAQVFLSSGGCRIWHLRLSWTWRRGNWMWRTHAGIRCVSAAYPRWQARMLQ